MGLSDSMYALEGYKREYMRRKGYVDISTAYPKGVPRGMGRYGGGSVLLAKIARGNVSGFSPAEVAYAREINDPRNTPLGHAIGTSSFRFPGIIPAEFTLGTSAQRAALSSAYEARVAGTTASRSASTGLAAGGTALAHGGPAVGTVPGGGLSIAPAGGLGGIGSSISNIGSSIMGTATGLLPLAVKVVLAVIAIKIVLWMVRGKK